MTKYIVVAGGVISGVGKGVATASIGRLMQSYGFSVTAIKIDPYLNFDAGTLRPTEHGEVWVTDDGGETDQDLGNYERFLSIPIPKTNCITTGQIYKTLIDKERRGDFLGETVEVIPHVPEEVKQRIINAAKGYDIALIEIGGTVGEYQNSIFLFSLRSLQNDVGKENICFMLVTYMPIPSHIAEMKTKPTQLAVSLIRQSGIEPDFVLCRGKKPLDDVRKKKLERNTNIKSDHIISMPDVTGKNTVNTLYVVPLNLADENLGEKLLSSLKLEKKHNLELKQWEDAVINIINAKNTVTVGMIGKYLDIGDYQLADSYVSVNEALKHACANQNIKLDLRWIDSKKLESGIDIDKYLTELDGVIIPGGFGASGVEGKIRAIQYCRVNNIPFLGLCYGLQLAVIEFARNVCGLDANTTEINPDVKDPVIDILAEQKSVQNKGGTMRLGAYPAVLKDHSRTFNLYGSKNISERHRHRYEVNPHYHDILQKNGLVFSGLSPDSRLVEFIELPLHKFFIATQAHPEFKSSLLKPAPLFDGFIAACIKKP